MNSNTRQRTTGGGGWTNGNKQLFVLAAKQVAQVTGQDADDIRYMLLRQCGDRAKLPNGRVSSTSPRLNQLDFEQCLAVLESTLDMWGQEPKLLDFQPWHFSERSVANGEQRLRWLVSQWDQAAMRHIKDWGDNALAAFTWKMFEKQVKELDNAELIKLVEAMKAMVQRAERMHTTGDTP